MTGMDLVLAVALGLIVFFAARYVVRAKKNGAKCIGCPMECRCKSWEGASAPEAEPTGCCGCHKQDGWQ